MSERSKKWDAKEKNGNKPTNTPLGNFKVLIFVGIALFAIIFAFIVFAVPAYSDGGFNIFPVKNGDYKTFKIFENGVTYKTARDGWYGYETVNILYDGQEYDCQPKGYHMNMYLNPICVEIIMRSLP